MLYSCTHMATVGLKGLIVTIVIHGCDQRDQSILFDAVHVTLGSSEIMGVWETLF